MNPVSKLPWLLAGIFTLTMTIRAEAGPAPRSTRARASSTTQSQQQQQRPAKKQVRARTRLPKMLKLKQGELYTWGTEDTRNRMTTSDPIMGRVKGVQNSMTLDYQIQGRSAVATTVGSKEKKGSERRAYTQAEQWKTVMVDKVGAHDNPEQFRRSDVAPIVAPVAAPFRLRGKREIAVRGDGARKPQMLKHRTNTLYGLTRGLPEARSSLLVTTKTSASPWTNITLEEGKDMPGRRRMVSRVVGIAPVWVKPENLGLTRIQRPSKGDTLHDGKPIPKGMGWVKTLNFAAMPRGTQVEVINLLHRQERAVFTAGGRNHKGNANQGRVLAEPGTHLAMIATSPSGLKTKLYLGIPSPEQSEVLIAGHQRRGKAKKSKRTSTYYRSTQVSARSLRISSAQRCMGCAKTSSPVVAVRLAEGMLDGIIVVKNLRTGKSRQVSAALNGELTIPAEVNDRLEITTRLPRQAESKMTVFVPAHNDGKRLETDAQTKREFYAPKHAPSR
jgi:hypothetical protein